MRSIGEFLVSFFGLAIFFTIIAWIINGLIWLIVGISTLWQANYFEHAEVEHFGGFPTWALVWIIVVLLGTAEYFGNE